MHAPAQPERFAIKSFACNKNFAIARGELSVLHLGQHADRRADLLHRVRLRRALRAHLRKQNSGCVSFSAILQGEQRA